MVEPQTGGPFGINMLAGTYMLNTGAPTTASVKNIAGWMTLDTEGNATATLYINKGAGMSPVQLTGFATVAANGRGMLAFQTMPNDVAIQNLVFWAISPDRWVAIDTVNSTDATPALLYIEHTGS